MDGRTRFMPEPHDSDVRRIAEMRWTTEEMARAFAISRGIYGQGRGARYDQALNLMGRIPGRLSSGDVPLYFVK